MGSGASGGGNDSAIPGGQGGIHHSFKKAGGSQQ
jgi:hypothetical protein